MEYTQDLEAPDAFHFWTGVSTIAGALRRKVWNDQHYFEWTPNFYILFIAKPGIAGKTTTSGIGHNLLAEVPDSHFGPEIATWQSLLDEIKDAQQTVTMPNGEIFTSSSMTIFVGEFGTFINPDDRIQIDVLTSLWDCRKQPFKKTTRTMGNTEVQNPWINMLACATPAWFSKHIPNYLMMAGIMSRMVIVYGDKKRKLTAYPGLARPRAGQLEVRRQLVSDLCEISNICGVYELAPAAVTWGEEWYNDLWTDRPLHLTSEKFDGYVSRKQTHIHKLAMVIAAARSNNLIIEKVHLETANRIVSGLENDMEQVFAKVGSHDTLEAYHETLAVVRAYGKVKAADLWRRIVSSFDGNHVDFEMVIKGLIAAGHIRQISIDGKSGFEALTIVEKPK